MAVPTHYDLSICWFPSTTNTWASFAENILSSFRLKYSTSWHTRTLLDVPWRYQGWISELVTKVSSCGNFNLSVLKQRSGKMHCPVFPNHFEERITWNTALLRPPGLTFACPRRVQSIPGLSVPSQRKVQTWAGTNAEEKARGVQIAVSTTIARKKKVEVPLALGKHRTKEMGWRKCNAFVRSRRSHNRSQLWQNYWDFIFAFTPIWPWCPCRSCGVAAPSILVWVSQCKLWWDLESPDLAVPSNSVIPMRTSFGVVAM